MTDKPNLLDCRTYLSKCILLSQPTVSPYTEFRGPHLAASFSIEKLSSRRDFTLGIYTLSRPDQKIARVQGPRRLTSADWRIHVLFGVLIGLLRSRSPTGSRFNGDCRVGAEALPSSSQPASAVIVSGVLGHSNNSELKRAAMGLLTFGPQAAQAAAGSTLSTRSLTTPAAAACSSMVLPAGGVVALENNPPMTLSHEAVFIYNCPTATPSAGSDTVEVTPLMMANSGGFNLDETVSGPGFSELRDPFYMTTFPIFYTLAATTVFAYTLVIMLFITPRSFVNGGVVYLGRRNGFTNGSTGVAFGQRPWLQKVACLTVAISLTIATGTSFKTAANHYGYGIVQNAQRLQVEVMDGTPLKAMRLISDTFLWLAQAQTLMHLYPTPKHKTIIKWAAFALITLEIIFSALNSFHHTDNGSQGNMRPRSFVDAIPALSYLFQLTMGLLYAAWVIYFIFTKKKYAFYHPLMKNMWLVALIALLAILMPIVFFILDISKPQVAGWGDYVRWVGAAAASVMVWEWVERIETLESEQKKDNILGRRIHDDGGEVAEASDTSWKKGGDGRHSSYSPRNRSRNVVHATDESSSLERDGSGEHNSMPVQPPLWPASATPVSRGDTGSTSALSRLRHHQQPTLTLEPVVQVPEPAAQAGPSRSRSNSSLVDPRLASVDETREGGNAAAMQRFTLVDDLEANEEKASRNRSQWQTLAQMANPMGMWTSRASEKAPERTPSHSSVDEYQNESIRARLQNFAASQAEKIQSKFNPGVNTEKIEIRRFPTPPPTKGASLERVDEESDGPPRQNSSSPVSSNQPANHRTSMFSGSRHGSIGRVSPSQTRRSRSVTSDQKPELASGIVVPPLWPGVESPASSSRGPSLDST